jgi:hypothetical protein
MASPTHLARQAVTEGVQSLELNFTSIWRGGGLPGATRLIEVLQPIQARLEYVDAVLAYNRAEFRLVRALGHPPALNPPPGPAPACPPPAPPAGAQ